MCMDMCKDMCRNQPWGGDSNYYYDYSWGGDSNYYYYYCSWGGDSRLNSRRCNSLLNIQQVYICASMQEGMATG